jgi:hypothetical protein
VVGGVDDGDADVGACGEHFQGEGGFGEVVAGPDLFAGAGTGDHDPGGRRASDVDVLGVELDVVDFGSGAGVVVAGLERGQQGVRVEGFGA